MIASNDPADCTACACWRRCSRYPDAELRSAPAARCASCCAASARCRAAAPRRARRADRRSCGDADPLDAEARYVELFDRGRATSLHLFEHVHGDSRDRGPAMVDLGQTYERAGLVLAERRAARLPAGGARVRVDAAAREAARLPRRDGAHPQRDLQRAARARQSPYASVLGALLELAGEKVAARAGRPPNEPLDESWAEPPAFDGCSTQGQAAPGMPQPIQIVRKGDAARKEPRHERVRRLPVRRLSVHLLRACSCSAA